MEFVDSVISQSCTESTKKFWKAVELWLKNPHYINRRIFNSIQLSMFKLQNVSNIDILKWFISFTKDCIIDENIEKGILNSLKTLNEENIDILDHLDDINYSQSNDNVIYLRFAKLLPRHADKFSPTLEVSLINLQNKCVTHLFRKYCHNEEKKTLGFPYPYQIRYENSCISIFVQNLDEWKDNRNLSWLRKNFFHKFLKWIVNNEQQTSLVDGSLKLVNLELYTNLYNNLKAKYGMEMVKTWPESTNPLKFVYEDIAIATYLLLLWQLERQKLNVEEKQSFLDLGCGNGLLVHILNSEGHPGFGIDLRRRKIWDLYPETTKLKVQTIIPSSRSLFPETDWLIGNHSDELTPWIPVIAARSSYKCRFFLLPCCAYEFNGKKYQRGNTATSQYSDYMKYIGEVSRTCGFKTDIDKLRIPSTKRICLIGTDRNYPLSDGESHDLEIRRMINGRCNDSDGDGAWSSEFRPRSAVESVRNCTQIDKGLISNIIDIVVPHLLREMRTIELVAEEPRKRAWNAGGEAPLSEIARAVGPELTKKLKSEYGGLQTLLKNNSHIFKVECGRVRLRVPGKDRIGRGGRSGSSSVTRKVKLCWFHAKHPDGCPQTDKECNFKH